jgi:hypothetical protein
MGLLISVSVRYLVIIIANLACLLVWLLVKKRRFPTKPAILNIFVLILYVINDIDYIIHL